MGLVSCRMTHTGAIFLKDHSLSTLLGQYGHNETFKMCFVPQEPELFLSDRNNEFKLRGVQRSQYVCLVKMLA